MTAAGVKLLSKGWWIPIGARIEGPKLEPEEPRAEVGFPTADQGFSSIQEALRLAFMAFKHCLMLGFHPAEWWIPAKRCRISVVRYRICY